MDFFNSLLLNSTSLASDLSRTHLGYDVTALNLNEASPYITSILRSYITPNINVPPFLSHLLQNPQKLISKLYSADLFTILALLVGLFVGFKVLDYVRRLIISWVVLAIKLVLLLCVVQVGIYFYTVGWERGLQDVGRVWGWIEGAMDGAGSASKSRGRSGGTNARGAGKWT